MKMLSKMFVIVGLAAFVPAPVFAQSADLIKQGDYYARPRPSCSTRLPRSSTSSSGATITHPARPSCSSRPLKS